MQTVDIAKQNQQVGADQLSNPGCKPVIVTVADLISGDGVVLVDDRYRAEIKQGRKGRARIEPAAPVLGHVEC